MRKEEKQRHEIEDMAVIRKAVILCFAEQDFYINYLSRRHHVDKHQTHQEHSLINPKMKLSTFITSTGLSLVRGAKLMGRQQDNCNRNNCYAAVWGTDPNLVPVRGVIACERYLATTEIVYPVYV
jgi:hypothetical protein